VAVCCKGRCPISSAVDGVGNRTGEEAQISQSGAEDTKRNRALGVRTWNSESDNSMGTRRGLDFVSMSVNRVLTFIAARLARRKCNHNPRSMEYSNHAWQPCVTSMRRRPAVLTRLSRGDTRPALLLMTSAVLLVVGLASCGRSQVAEGPLPPPPFVVATIPRCSASLLAAAENERPRILDLNRGVQSVVIGAYAPMTIQETNGNVPLSLTTRPTRSFCALSTLDGNPAGTQRRTVAFTRRGRIELDIFFGGEGAITELIHVNVE
jgi:hypothetical protein